MLCLNEEKTIGTCIKKAKKYLENSKIKGEMLKDAMISIMT